MTSYLYVLSLMVSICGLGVLDYRYRLAYFVDRRATLLTIGGMVAFFVIWDVIGIELGIFFTGKTAYLSGIELAADLPLEELFFLVLLSYVTLLVWRKAEQL